MQGANVYGNKQKYSSEKPTLPSENATKRKKEKWNHSSTRGKGHFLPKFATKTSMNILVTTRIFLLVIFILARKVLHYFLLSLRFL